MGDEFDVDLSKTLVSTSRCTFVKKLGNSALMHTVDAAHRCL